MKNTLLFLIAFGLLICQGGTPAMGEKAKFYQLTYQTENVTGMVTINGFPVTELNIGNGSGTASLNPWLIGENEVRVELKKADKAQPASFSYGVSELEQGAMVSTMDKGKMFAVELKDQDFKGGTASSSRKFRSTFDFSPTLVKGGAAKDSEVLAYAQKFYGLFVKKDLEAILKEWTVKIADFSQAYGGVDMQSEMRSYLKDDLLKSKLAKVVPVKLKVVPVGPTGKVWQVKNGQDELIKVTSPDGSTGEIAVFIAQVGGKLQVVR